MELDLFGETITTTKPSKKTAEVENQRPSVADQKAAVKVGVIDPVLYESLIVKAQMITAPGMPVKDDKGIYAPGADVPWFPRRGNGKKGIMLVSAYPSEEEKRQKKVLVGPGGQTTALALADNRIDMDEDCYITNVLRYYFPAKSNPSAIAIEQCTPYLLAEIEYCKPKLIICLGGTALKAVLGRDVSLDDFRGERIRPEGKDYEVAALWQPAYVLREPETLNVWRDDLAFVLGQKPLPKGAKDHRLQDQLPQITITNKRDLKTQVTKIIEQKETEFCIDTEFFGDDPNHSTLLRVQIATASRNLLLVLNEGHWKPKIYPKTAKKGHQEMDIAPKRIVDLIVDKGFDQAAIETGRSLATIFSVILSPTQEPYYKERLQEKVEGIREAEGAESAKKFLLEHEEQSYRCMTDGTVMVFNQRSELEDYLVEHESKLRTNLIAYVEGADYVFDCDEKEVGRILTPLFYNPNGTLRDNLQLYGQNGNVDWTRLKAYLGLDLTNAQTVDTMLLALILDEGQPRGLENLSKRYNNAPNHKLALLDHMAKRGLKNKAYCFARPDVLNPYSFTDSRRNFDMVAPMMAALEAETERVLNLEDSARVPMTNPGETMYKAKYWRQDLKVNNWERSTAFNLYTAFTNLKMGQYKALNEPMQIGQPFNAAKTQELINWYEKAAADQMAKCREAVKLAWKNPDNPEEVKLDFNPQSGDECAFLLYYILGHRPTKSTGSKSSANKPQEWNDKLHQEWVANIKAGRKPKIKPATDSKDLETLAEHEPMAKMIGDTRTLLTIVKNYMRKGGRWKDKNITIRKQQIDEVEIDAPFRLDDYSSEEIDDKIGEELEGIVENAGEDWGEYKKDQTSRSISLLISDDNKIFSCYYPTLETQRLATVPNVSAIIRDETRYVKDIVGSSPPCNIRQLNEADEDWFISSNDWKAAEVYMIAVLSHWRSIRRGKEQRNLLDIIGDSKRCIHASTARKMFPAILGNLSDMEIKELYPHLRELAKPVVFGIPYGRGAKAIAVDLNRNAINNWLEKRAKHLKEGKPAPEKPVAITVEQAEGFIEAYYEVAPEAWDFLQEQMSLVHNPGFQINPWGFVRRYPNLASVKDVSELERQAANWQIQGGVACAMMQTCIKWNENYKQRYPKLPMYLIDILHDATKFLFHKSMLPYHEEIIQDLQGDGLLLPFDTPVKMQVEPSIYKSYELKEYKGSIKLQDTKDPKKHAETFLGKYGDTPENREFYAKWGSKSDYARFVGKYAHGTDCLTREYSSLQEFLPHASA